MLIAVWIIAVCEVIRLVQNTLQLVMSKQDLAARIMSNKRYMDGLDELDKMLDEIREADNEQVQRM